MEWRQVLEWVVKSYFPYLVPVLARTKIVEEEKASIQIGRSGNVVIGVPSNRFEDEKAALTLTSLMQVAMGHVWRGSDDVHFHLASDLLITHILKGLDHGVPTLFSVELERLHLLSVTKLWLLGLNHDQIQDVLALVQGRKSVEEVAARIRLYARMAGEGRGNGVKGLAIWQAEGSKEERLEAYRNAGREIRKLAARYGVLPGDSVVSVVTVRGKRSWKKIVRRFVSRTSRYNVSYSRPEKRLLHLGVIAPGHARGKAKLAVILDTSGSISDDMLRAFVGEVRRMLAENDVEGYLILADVKVQAVLRLSEVRNRIPIPGRGGTSFVDAIRRAEDLKVNGIIYFTDLEGEFPDWKPRVPVFWVVPRHYPDMEVPFGKVVEL